MKAAAILLATALLAASGGGDDQLRDVQAELKSEGFYYGEPDGKEGPETSAAIRRFQIRHGLQITGKLNAETLEALGIGAAPERPAPGEPKPPAQVNPPPPGEMPVPPKRADLLRERPVPDGTSGLRERRPEVDDEGEAPDAPRARRGYPDDPAVVEPPTPVPGATYDEFTTFYHGTPYASAPREVQLDVARKAQIVLARRGLYRARLDGLPGPATADALFAFQEERRLPRTGRLDLRTLAEMNLLPGRGPDAPAMMPFRNPNRGRDRGVDYGGFIR
jgi:peptidoglycan hydrolase-like protein with peptidoglycan-binding domain